jgi:AraC family transcriptional regulator, regulatory protein of adaptative response / DNA-3-methyladenine glycosylase II
VIEDFERCYRAVSSRDARFDGWFFTGVTSTGIYCRPSCPAMTPKRANLGFYPTAAAAQSAGFRACLRCRPDAAPGSPEWNMRADVTARAMRLIADGTVDREGVAGLSRHLGYSERQLQRLLVAEVGTGALALARAQRAQTARILLETTQLPASQIAFAAGFASVRQFNDTMRQVFSVTPTSLRARRPVHVRKELAGTAAPGAITLRLAYRQPFDADSVFSYLAYRIISGVESYEDGVYRRTLSLPWGDGVAELAPADGHIRCVLHLDDLRDLTTAVSRCRRLLDLDADPVATMELLGRDDDLGRLVKKNPGRRVPGATDGNEIAVRAMVGQQISVAGAGTVLTRLVQAVGSTLTTPHGSLTHRFPSPAQLVDLARDRPKVFSMPTSRRNTIANLCAELAAARIGLDPGSERTEVVARLEAQPGIGPWTSHYIAMRALGDPDIFLPTDIGIRRAAAALGLPDEPRQLSVMAERWRPWRSYAMAYLWAEGAPSASTRPSTAPNKRRKAA